MRKELECNSGPLSRSHGLEMIGFPIVYWGAPHDESSLHSKSTPIKWGLFIPLWDTSWILAWNEPFQPSLFCFNKQHWHSQGLVKCVCVAPYCGAHICCGSADSCFICSPCARVYCVCWYVAVSSAVSVSQLCVYCAAQLLFVPVASCL